MKTAALLPTPGDPFLVRHWLRNCERVWRGEVDELRVFVGGQPNDDARAYIRRAVEDLDGVYMEAIDGVYDGKRYDEQVPHGDALRILIEETDADVVLLMEDDVRVRHKYAVGYSFDRIKMGQYDVVSSPRGSMSGGLQQRCIERKWATTPLVDLGREAGMWPAFVFAKRADLLATDRNFGPQAYVAGDTVPGLHWTLPPGAEECADTFGNTAFQLRDTLRVYDQPQWKGPWHWAQWLDHGKDEIMDWFHIGSLSSSGDLVAENPPFQDPRVLTDEMEQREWAHRLHWWGRCLVLHGWELPRIADTYKHNLERLRVHANVPMEYITDWDAVTDRIVTWDET
jgi:hypothetical protein